MLGLSLSLPFKGRNKPFVQPPPDPNPVPENAVTFNDEALTDENGEFITYGG